MKNLNEAVRDFINKVYSRGEMVKDQDSMQIPMHLIRGLSDAYRAQSVSTPAGKKGAFIAALTAKAEEYAESVKRELGYVRSCLVSYREAIDKMAEKGGPAEGVLFADHYDSCILGLAWPWHDDQDAVVVYDGDRVLEVLMDGNGMNREEAMDFFSFNIGGAFVGKRTPIFVWRPEEENAR